jgi:hypothetical protein
LDEAEAFLVIEELHGSLRHITLLSDAAVMRAAHLCTRLARPLEKGSSVRCGVRGEAKPFGRSSISLHGASQLDHKVYPARVLRKG